VDAVLHDVRQGYVSIEAASALYGVVVNAETMEADLSATTSARGKLQAAEAG
jgi:N-methylhydantoinase B/oxoprolinase/acetone carboxylase alpha subunit